MVARYHPALSCDRAHKRLDVHLVAVDVQMGDEDLKASFSLQGFDELGLHLPEAMLGVVMQESMGVNKVAMNSHGRSRHVDALE